MQLQYLLAEWTQRGADVPFSFDELATYATKSGAQAPDLVKQLLGPLWDGWFKADANKDTIVPRQAAFFVQQALVSIGAPKGTKLEEKRTAAAEGFAKIKEKRVKRASPL